MPGKEHVTAADISRVTGLDARYIAHGMGKRNIDLSTVKSISDGRVVARTHGGTKLILQEKIGVSGRGLQWSTYRGSVRLLMNPDEYEEIHKYGAVVHYVTMPE